MTVIFLFGTPRSIKFCFFFFLFFIFVVAFFFTLISILDISIRGRLVLMFNSGMTFASRRAYQTFIVVFLILFALGTDFKKPCVVEPKCDMVGIEVAMNGRGGEVGP